MLTTPDHLLVTHADRVGLQKEVLHPLSRGRADANRSVVPLLPLFAILKTRAMLAFHQPPDTSPDHYSL